MGTDSRTYKKWDYHIESQCRRDDFGESENDGSGRQAGWRNWIVGCDYSEHHQGKLSNEDKVLVGELTKAATIGDKKLEISAKQMITTSSPAIYFRSFLKKRRWKRMTSRWNPSTNRWRLTRSFGMSRNCTMLWWRQSQKRRTRLWEAANNLLNATSKLINNCSDETTILVYVIWH